MKRRASLDVGAFARSGRHTASAWVGASCVAMAVFVPTACGDSGAAGTGGGGDAASPDAAMAGEVSSSGGSTDAASSTGSGSTSSSGGASSGSASSGGSSGGNSGDGGNPPGNSGTVTGCAPGSATVTITHGSATLAYDLTAGTATFQVSGKTKIAAFTAEVKLASTTVSSAMYTARTCATTGATTTITLTGSGLPTMQQIFVSNSDNHFLTQVSLQGSALSSNWMAPLVTTTAGSVDVGSYGDARVLVVPFDNDMFVTYDAAPLSGASGTSFEVGAFYDNTSRNGIVVGSVTHDTWKTGVDYQAGSMTVDSLQVYGGANDANMTHDLAPHGAISGSTITSPMVFLGYGPDWRDMMEAFADANTAYAPMLPWTGGVPLGWNSWGVIQTAINYTKAIAVSDFMKSALQSANFNNGGTVYIDLDSYWDNLSDSELAMFAAHCHANGQKAGAYWGPFADWGSQMPQAQVKDSGGNSITVDGAPALDPTHPDVKSRIDSVIGKFKTAGLDYVKLDFLTHGSLESSVRADPTVKTGIQAYSQGMKYILDKIGGTMFVDESIAPLFPYQYGNGRRVSCDAFGNTGASTYELNSASYGWWLSGHLYAYNDPDQLVFQGFSATENMLRLMSGIVTGGIFFDGDDLTGTTGQAAATNSLNNAAFDAVARIGKAFRPVEGNSGTDPASLLVMTDSGDTYVAVLNYGSTGSVSVDLGRVGLDASKSYTVTDLWTGTTSMGMGMISVAVDGGSGKLLKLR